MALVTLCPGKAVFNHTLAGPDISSLAQRGRTRVATPQLMKHLLKEATNRKGFHSVTKEQ